MVKPFQFTSLPVIYFGNGKITDLPGIIKVYGKKIVLVTGKNSFLQSRQAGTLFQKLEETGIKYHQVIISGEPSTGIIDQNVARLSGEEIDAVVNRASELGVKILLNHPYYGFDAQTKFVEGWAKLGAYVELTAVWFLMQGSKSYGIIADLLSRIPIEKFVLDSDLGQAKNESPVDGLYRFIEILMQEIKVTEQQINLIGKEIPSKIMGI